MPPGKIREAKSNFNLIYNMWQKPGIYHFNFELYRQYCHSLLELMLLYENHRLV
jgi:hypothetical protein